MWYANVIIDRGLSMLKAKEIIFFVVLFIINLNGLLSSSQSAFHKLLSLLGYNIENQKTTKTTLNTKQFHKP